MKDCCAATCSQPHCGTVGSFTEAFGVAVNASEVVGFPDCKDPSMVPITIHVQNFVNSWEPQYFDLWWLCGMDNETLREDLVQMFGDLDGIRANFDEFVSWVNENSYCGEMVPYTSETLSYVISDPIIPSMSLYCDQKNVLSINIDKSMEDKYEVVMVEDGAKCTFDIENATLDGGFSFLQEVEPTWYINYTIYHDKAMQVKIDEGFSFEEGTKQFTRIPDCFLDTILGYSYDSQNFDYIDLTRKFNWLVEHDTRNQPCSSDFSIERYALSVTNMVSNYSASVWKNDDMHCVWPRVKCKQGLVVSLKELYGEAGQFIPEEVGMLTNLETLDFSYHGLTGSIPTEVGLLTELTYLSLSKSPFSFFLTLRNIYIFV